MSSTQADLNSHPYEYFLYYCYQNTPTVVYQTDLSDVCTLYFDINSDIQISSWIVGAFGPPTMPTTLLAYSLSTVLNFYLNFYTIPQQILAAQPYTISSSNLANVLPTSNMIGFLVFDSTVRKLKFWSGSSWVVSSSLLLAINGSSTMTGNLDLGTKNIINIGNLSQSTPSATSTITTASAAISYTAATPKLVSVGSFSQSSNPNSDFSLDTSTGKCTYTGSSTKWFHVTINYSSTGLAVSSTLTNYISVNGSLTVAGARNVQSYLLLGSITTDAYSLSDVVQLNTNDTVQLAGNNSVTASITYSNISYAISQI